MRYLNECVMRRAEIQIGGGPFAELGSPRKTSTASLRFLSAEANLYSCSVCSWKRAGRDFWHSLTLQSFFEAIFVTLSLEEEKSSAAV